MKFIGLWILCLFIGKDRVRGDDYQCQGKCNEPKVSNGTSLLVPGTTPADYDGYGNYDYDVYSGGVVPTYDSDTVMSVQCFDSYWFKGTKQSVGSIRCGCEGRWDPGVNEACVVAKCDPTPQFGGVLKSSSSCFADSADLTTPVAANNSACLHCLPGFKIAHQEGLKDSIEVQCGTNGKWKIPAQCENQIACTRPLPSERTNTYSKIKDNFDATLQMEFECTRPDVMVMFGDPVVKCSAGHWSADPLPVCRHKYSCLLDIQHGHVEKSSASTPTHGPWARNSDSGTVRCDQGYESITDDDTITCNKGKWQPAPHCVQSGQIGKCETPPLRNGTVTLSHKKTFPGAVASHTCAAGYTLKGAANRTCLSNGVWDGAEVSCVIKATCDKPPAIAHAWHTPDKAYYHGEKYRYTCHSGYERRGGGSYYQCNARRNRWEALSYDTRLMRCEPVNCGDPAIIPNADSHLVGGRITSFGAEVRYQCKTGYKKTRGILMSTICQANERWTVIGLRCDIVTCPPLTNPPNGNVQIRRGKSNRFEYGSEYKYTCDSGRGYRLEGKQIDDETFTSCTQYGNWTYAPSKIACELVDCYDPGHIFNGYLQAGLTTYSSQRRFGCNDFTTMDPVINPRGAYILCQKDGRWSNSLPKCWAKCRVPSLGNGNYETKWGGSFSPSALEHENSVKLQCDRGYTTDIRYPSSSTKTLQCDNGTLTQGSCTEKPCDKLSETDENLLDVTYSTDIIDVGTSKYYTHGTTADITCLDTHETANRGSTLRLTCNKRRWNKRTRICEPKDCFIPASVSSDLSLYTTNWQRRTRTTYYYPMDYVTHDTIVTISCSASKTVFNSTMKRIALTTRCKFGKWENKEVFDATCVPNPCDKLNENRLVVDSVHYSKPIVSLGWREEYVRHESNVSFTCKPNYEVSENEPSGWVKCDTGKYRPGNVPQPQVCQEKGCRVPSHADRRHVINNILYHPFDRYFNHRASINIACEDGFVLNSSKTNPPITTQCNFGIWTLPGAFREQCVEAPCALSKWQKDGVAVTNAHDTIRIDAREYVAHGNEIDVGCRGTHYLARWRHSSGRYGYSFEATGTSTIRVTCQKGAWEPTETVISCKPKGCRVPSHADRRHVINNILSHPFDRYFNHRASINIACEDGFVLNSSKTNPPITTQCNFGIWSFPGAFREQCVEAPCALSKWQKDGVAVTNAHDAIRIDAREYVAHESEIDVGCRGTHYLARRRNYSGRYGYYFGATGTSTIRVTCQKGAWDPTETVISCKPRECRLPTGHNQELLFSPRSASIAHDAIVYVSCPRSQVFSSTMNRNSLTTKCKYGNWSDVTVFGKKCEQAPCDKLDEAFHSLESVTYSPPVLNIPPNEYVRDGTNATFSCKPKYEVSENTFDGWRRCDNGNYNGLSHSPICKERRCTCPQDTDLHSFKCDDISVQHGTALEVMCKPGYEFNIRRRGVVKQNMDCQFGNFSAVPPCRNASCSLTNPANGNFNNSYGSIIAHGQTVRFQCSSSYVIDAGDDTPGFSATTGESVCNKGEMKPKWSCKKVDRYRPKCDFEDGLCDWSHGPSGNFTWSRTNGSTSRGAGPSSDHTEGISGDGFYMYMETFQRTINEKAILLSPKNTEHHSSRCLRFYYYMSGKNIGRLRVYVLTGYGRIYDLNQKWEKADGYGDHWWLATLDVGLYVDEQIGIEGNMGSGHNGGIALDDITLSDDFCPRKACPPIVHRSGISVTGGNGPGEEVMLECLNGQKRLKITCHQSVGTWSESATLFDCVDQSSATTVAATTGSTTVAATTGSTTVAATTGSTTVAATTGSTTEAAATSTHTSAEGFRCDFDNDICKWTHDPSSDFNWTRHQGRTPTDWTGPLSDHASSNGHYMLMSSLRFPGEKARLKSPKLGNRDPKCFEFYFNKYSYLRDTNYASTLKVYVGNATQPVFSDKGFHNIRTWIHQRIDVFGYPGEKIIIEGVVGPSTHAVIAIDDVSLTEGPCPPSSVCSDTRSACSDWKNDCRRNASVRRLCKKTCGLCR
ncbi:sushi, von Willebrand factor type A, EGF and pentraxin domain-containing protein 1-like [Lineus longissimus]|uniref:sushi, von Willebrand factor type A, EGF and pentraxin domain-containing protein 1-like n=1 Tax=Lineus longissimus TaxID=88925 RepID=UPI00315DB2C3